MAFNIDYYTRELEATRLLRTNQEIDRFEEAMTTIYEQDQIRYLPALCVGFDDRSEHEEVTWGLIHVIEDFYAKNPAEFDKIFIKVIDEDTLMPQAQGWLELLVTRTLNEEESRESFKNSLMFASPHVKQVVKRILSKLIQEDPKQFRDSSIELLSATN